MKLGWQITIVVAAIAAGLYLSRKPWQVYGEQRNNLADIKAEMREAEAERERMLREKMDLSSPLGKERRIRDAGALKKGEKYVEN